MKNSTLPKHYENGQFAAIIAAELASPIVLSKPTVSLVSLGGEGVQYSNKTPNGWMDFVFLIYTQLFQPLVKPSGGAFTIV